MRQAVRKVAQALHDFARGRKWKFADQADWRRGDYYIEIIVNADWDRINVTFVAKAFKGQDESERYNLVQDYLEEKLKDHPEIVEATNLVVKDPDQFAAEGPIGLRTWEVAVPEDFLKYIPHRRLKSS